MKIVLGNFTLAAGGDESPQDLRINGQQQVQTAFYLRAAGAIPIPRGNRVHTITFAVTREHKSYAAAEEYLWTHAYSIPASGALTMTTEPSEGGVVQYQAAVTALNSDSGSQLGLTTTHQYTLQCGPFTGGTLGLK